MVLRRSEIGISFIEIKKVSTIYFYLYRGNYIYFKNKKFLFHHFQFFSQNPTKPGHFSRTLSKGPNTTTWIWNLHADAHDFDSHTSDLEEISRKVFSAHFGQLGVIFIWLSGCDTKKKKWS